jgi:putative transposase
MNLNLYVEYGNWNSIFKRFNRWSRKGIWQQLSHAVADIVDLENLAIDSTIVRAHPWAAGAKGGPQRRD